MASKTWKGVVTKNKIDLPAHHENKIGIVAHSLTNRTVLFNNQDQDDNTPSIGSSIKAPARYQSESFKQSKF